MKIAAVVPMKLNNSRFPQKNTRPFTNGLPLCCYILNTLLMTEGLEGIYVYCSSDQIKDYLPKGVTHVKRSQLLDADSVSMTEVLQCFASDIPADIYLMTHTTAPFIKKESIERGIQAVLNEGFDSAFAAKKLQDFLWSEGKPLNYSPDLIPRTQDLPVLYQETSGFYIYTRDTILKQGRRIGEKPYIVEVSEVESVDIDEAEDFTIADALFNFLFLPGEKDREKG